MESDIIDAPVQVSVNIHADVSKHPLAPFSEEVEAFVQSLGEDVNELATKPVLTVPPTPDDYPLSQYFISSSHNTYLLSRQLIGTASVSAYSHVLRHGARCVEIDVWPHPHSKKDPALEPIVTHGYTFSKSIPFRDVCRAIYEGINDNDWPILVSLECHVPLHGQALLVDIMREEWQDRLVSEIVVGSEDNEITPRDLKGRILLIVEYYTSANAAVMETDEDESSSSEEYSDSEEAQMLRDIKQDKLSEEEKKISPDLAKLGVYVQSMKPKKNWLAEKLDPKLHILINISETALSALLPGSLKDLIAHSSLHLRRVYPKGTRISSGNLDPLKFWRTGTHISALNWQKFDHGTQLNEAMFVGAPGYVLKGESMRVNTVDIPVGKRAMSCHVFGISGLLPLEEQQTHFKVRLKVTLMHSSGEEAWKSKVVSCSNPGNPVFDETFSMTFPDEELVFIRIVVEEEGVLKSRQLCVFCARIQHLVQGWRFVRLLSNAGKHLGSTLLLNFSFSDEIGHTPVV